MIDLSKHIEYLLLKNDQVRVPQFGEFSATYICSKWIEDENLYLPPLRSVSLSIDTTTTSELFLKSLSKNYNITTQEANIMCTEFAESTFQTLQEEGDVEIGSIGTLVHDESANTTLFIPNQAGIASPSLYGLDALQIPYLSKDSVETRETTKTSKKVKVTTLNADEHTITIKINRQVLNYVAAIAASIVLFFTFATPTINNSMTEQQIADTNFFIPANLNIRQAKQSIKSAVEVKQLVEKQETENVVVETITDERQEPIQVNTTKPGYAIVMASAISVKNAERFIKKLSERGYKAEMLNNGKMNRVIIPGFSSESEAHSKIKELRKTDSDFKKAWAMKLD